jgi:hypothetical protein
MPSATLDRIQDRVFGLVSATMWLLYLSVALGLSARAPEYLGLLQNAVKTYVSLYLVYRFNPLRHVAFTALDAKITFSAGMFLLVSMALSSDWGVRGLRYLTDLLR